MGKWELKNLGIRGKEREYGGGIEKIAERERERGERKLVAGK